MSNSPEFHQITLMVGGLKQAVESMSDQWKRQEESAVAGRRALHEKFETFRDDVVLQISGLNLRLDRVVDTMSKIEPAVKKYEEEKLREEGAKTQNARIGKLVVAVMGAIGTGIGWGLHELIGWFKH